MIYLKLQGNVGVKMLQTYRKNRILFQRRFFDKWRMQSKSSSAFEKLAKMLDQNLNKKKMESDKVTSEMKSKKEELVKASTHHKELQEKYRVIRKKIVEAEEALA